MDTDEYEISIHRELQHHRRVVRTIQENLAKRRQQYDMDYAEAAQAMAAGLLKIDAGELAKWQDDVEALPLWEQRLEEYRQALALMRVSTSR